MYRLNSILGMMRKIYIPIFRGSIEVVYDGDVLYSVRYIDVIKKETFDDRVSSLFSRYVEGKKTDFTGLKLNLGGLTEFQRRVYNVVRMIPYGETRSYRWVSEQLGIKSPRAVGQALKRNPFLIVVPCHRVIKSDGGLGGFTSIHGTEFKKYLLKLEGIDI